MFHYLWRTLEVWKHEYGECAVIFYMRVGVCACAYDDKIENVAELGNNPLRSFYRNLPSILIQPSSWQPQPPPAIGHTTAFALFIPLISRALSLTVSHWIMRLSSGFLSVWSFSLSWLSCPMLCRWQGGRRGSANDLKWVYKTSAFSLLNVCRSACP